MQSPSTSPKSRDIDSEQALNVLLDRLESNGLKVTDASPSNVTDNTITVEIEFPRPTVDDPYAAERSERGFLDYTDSRHLEWAYVTTQTIQEAAEQFEACYDTVRYQMVQEEIHCPEKQGEPSD